LEYSPLVFSSVFSEDRLLTVPPSEEGVFFLRTFPPKLFSCHGGRVSLDARRFPLLFFPSPDAWALVSGTVQRLPFPSFPAKPMLLFMVRFSPPHFTSIFDTCGGWIFFFSLPFQDGSPVLSGASSFLRWQERAPLLFFSFFL